jgi:TIR domain
VLECPQGRALRVTLGISLMPSGPGERYDFFLSRRGSVAAIAREVTDVLTEKGYKVFVQDYDIPLTANFIEEMHEAIKNARDLVVLFTRDYEQSPYTRMEFTSFWSALAITECETWEHRRHWRLFTGRGRPDGAFVGCQGDHHPVTVREMRRTPRGGQWYAKSVSHLLARA